jgi:L-amino acid N-acyltransferase YncA
MAPGEVTIRRAELSDARTIAEINYASWEATYRGLMPDALLDGMSVDDRERRQREHLAVPAAESQRSSWIAERDGAPVGYASLGPMRGDDAEAGVGELYAIYLLPAAIGRGIGRRLLSRALETLRAAGHHAAVVWFHSANERARRFYEAGGFEVDVADGLVAFAGFELPSTRYRVRLSGADGG